METPILTQQERATWCLFIAQAYYRAEGSARSSDFIKHCVGISAVILDVTEHNLDWAFDCLWNLNETRTKQRSDGRIQHGSLS